CTVALIASESLVDVAQPIDVDDSQHQPAHAVGELEMVLAEREKAAPIVEAGQLVAQCELAQRGLQAMPLDRVAENAAEVSGIELVAGDNILRSGFGSTQADRFARGAG